jgi:hypothetical protein
MCHHLGELLPQVLHLRAQVEDLGALEDLVQKPQRGLDLDGGPAAVHVPLQTQDGLKAQLLQPGDGALDQATPRPPGTI